MNYQVYFIRSFLILLFFSLTGYWSYQQYRSIIKQAQNILEMEKKLSHVDNNISFANEISAGNLSVNYSLLDESDELGKSLMTMRKSLVESSQREQEEKFITIGITKVGDIIRTNNDNVKKLADEFISGIVKYLGINQGAVFLHEEDGSDQYLNLVAAYAYERRKFLSKRIDIGFGLLGQCFQEKDIIYMTKVPDEYTHITSGLGEATPGCLFIMPLMTNETIVGVMELASFKPFSNAQIEFIKRSAENIASSIVSSRITERVKRLLEESQQQTEEMKAQEEEMRQNMEELQATQEEMERKQQESEAMKRDLGVREDVLSLTTILSETDVYGTITFVNKKFCEVAKYEREELMGKPQNIVRHPDMPKELFKLFWDTIKRGQVFRGFIKNRAKDGTPYWVDATIVPIKNDNGDIIKYVGARYHIKDEEWAKQKYEAQMRALGLPLYARTEN